MTRYEEARCAGSERKGGGIKGKRLEEEERVGKSEGRKIIQDKNRRQLVMVPKGQLYCQSGGLRFGLTRYHVTVPPYYLWKSLNTHAGIKCTE